MSRGAIDGNNQGEKDEETRKHLGNLSCVPPSSAGVPPNCLAGILTTFG